MGKNIRLGAMILILAFLCCGCSHDKKMVNHIEEKLEESKVIGKDATYVYDIKDLDKYCFDASGIIYVLDGKNNCIRNYNPEGNQTREYTITSDKTISSFCYLEGKIYYIIYDSLYQLDLETGESVFCYQFEGDYFSFGGMVALKDALFILRTHQFKEEQMEIRYDEQDEYSYEGEELVCFDPSTLELEYIEIPNMKLITKKSDQELLIYAYDEEGGFYFTSYEVGDKWSEKKQYTNMKLGYLYNIAYDSVMERIICSNEKGIFTTSELDFAKQSYIYEQNSGRINDNTLQYQDGFTYDIRQMDGFNKIVRLQNTALIKENPVLKAYTLNSSYQPNGFGYQIEYEELDETELATVLMAGDSDYDIAILDASHEISRNILDVGAYYSLNSFEGIEEFLDQCWDYVKDAALASDGRIWMLPIKVECPILIYNKNLSKDYGMDINALNTYSEFIDYVVNLPKNDEIHYNIPYYYMTIDITNKYISNYAVLNQKSNFKTDIFRDYLKIMNEYDTRFNEGEMIFGSVIEPQYNKDDSGGLTYEEYQAEYYSNVLFEMLRSTEIENKYGFNYDRYDYFSAVPMPRLEEEKALKTIADCYFIVVNPNSKRLEWTRDYLTKVCEDLRNDSDSFLLKENTFKDSPLKTEIQEVIADANILFEYPYEIISDEMRAYRLEGKSLEDTISEIERKMDMYLNE